MDGHNVIGRVPELARLQAADRGEEARDRVARASLSFSLRHRTRVILVFDGRPGHVQAAMPRSRHLETVFATGPGRADAAIIARANLLVGQGEPVTVVTDDRGIRVELLRGVVARPVAAFWELAGIGAGGPGGRGGASKASSRDSEGDEKPAPGSMPDLERHFLDAEARRKRRKP